MRRPPGPCVTYSGAYGPAGSRRAADHRGRPPTHNGPGPRRPRSSVLGGFVVAVPDAEPLPVLEALHSPPARRYMSPEPIPDEVIWAILDAAVRGPSGGNQQGWGWVVGTAPAPK